MLEDLLVKILVTPENILGLIWNIISIVGLGLIFHVWEEKWWKSLIPVYGTYIICRHAWKERKWIFVIFLIFDMLVAISTRIMKKSITSNLFSAIKTYVETKQLDIDINVSYLVVCVIVLLISMIVIFILTRITYLKICESLNINNALLRVGTFFVPQIFLVVDYIYYKRENDITK